MNVKEKARSLMQKNTVLGKTKQRMFLQATAKDCDLKINPANIVLIQGKMQNRNTFC